MSGLTEEIRTKLRLYFPSSHRGRWLLDLVFKLLKKRKRVLQQRKHRVLLQMRTSICLDRWNPLCRVIVYRTFLILCLLSVEFLLSVNSLLWPFWTRCKTLWSFQTCSRHLFRGSPWICSWSKLPQAIMYIPSASAGLGVKGDEVRGDSKAWVAIR